MKDPIAQYLARHAEPEAALAGRLPGSFGHVLVVPAYGEGESLFKLLGSVPGGPAGPVLIVLVLNARADSPRAVHEANEEVRSRLEKELAPAAGLEALMPARAYPLRGGTLLVVDRALAGRFLPEGQGVGLARKIGNDIALRAERRIASPWIQNTDADSALPGDYFEQTVPLDAETTGAAIYSYEHRFDPDPALGEAGRLYEISLRYSVLGLAWAGSPFAYHSMGSCLAIPASAYAQVRGFPKRNTLEDFHALSKLAKVGRILRLTGRPLLLEGRVSERVPISTGVALAGLVSKRGALSGFRLYHPLVFAHLAAWLRVLAAIARSGGDARAARAELPSANPFFRTDLLTETLERMGAFRAVQDPLEGRGDSSTPPSHLVRRTEDREGVSQSRRQVLVEEQLHSGGVETNFRSRSAANARQARMSSRVRSGKSRMISSSDMPDARYSSTSYTVIRNPRIHGLPPRLPGSIVISLR